MADKSRDQRRKARKAPAPAAPEPPRSASLAAWFQARPVRIAIALAALHLVLALVAFNPSPFTGGDNGAYMALGRSLAERHAYLSLWDPGAPAHTQYPPVWPAIIAVLWMLGARGWLVMKGAVLVFSVLCTGLTYLWLRRTTTPGVALAVGLLLAVSPGVLEQSHLELSDVPAWAFTLLALWASTHLAGSPERERLADEQRHGLWLGVLVAGVVLGNFTRAAGLPLVVAAFAWLALRRRWVDLGVLAAVFLPLFGLWWWWGAAHGGVGYTSYLWAVDPYQPRLGNVGWKGMLFRTWINSRRYAGYHLPVLLRWDPSHGFLFGMPVLLLAVVGWAMRMRKPGLAEVWAIPYVGLLLVWPSTWSGERFLLPLLAPVLCWAAEGLRFLIELGFTPRVARLGTLAAGVALLLAMLPGVSTVALSGRECSRAYREGDPFPCMAPEYHDFFAIAAAARGALPAGSAVLSRKPTLFYAMSGYPGRTYPMSANPDTFFAFARQTRARYVVYDQVRDLAPLYLHPVLLARRDDFCVLPGFVLPATALLRIEQGAPRRTGVAENSFRQCGPSPAR